MHENIGITLSVCNYKILDCKKILLYTTNTMKTIYCLPPFLLFLFSVHGVIGQETQWASRIIEASPSYQEGFLFKAQLQHGGYPAERLLGQPNVLPGNSGDSPNAWVPKKPNQEVFIKVGFDAPQTIQQIAIAESRNPGAVYQLFCYDISDKEYLVATLEPAPVNTQGRMFNVFIDPTNYPVQAVKVVLQGDKVPGYNAIDAIAISSSALPIRAEINIVPGLNPDVALDPLLSSADSSTANLSPMISPDGNTLFFGRVSPYNVGGMRDEQDIWYMERDSPTSAWGKPKNMGKPLNNKNSNYVSAVAADGDSYLLLLGNAYQEDGKMKNGVSITRRTESGWSQPEALNVADFYNNSDIANYFMSEDQRFLFMALERDDTEGKRDLYVSFNRGENIWSEPLNLGPAINTADVESSPFLANDTTLYFSSRGYSGFGGEDVYVAYRTGDSWTEWTEPENLGPSINSEQDDTFFNVSTDNQYAFLTRGTTNGADMYQVRMPVFRRPGTPDANYLVRGLVYNVKNNMPVEAKVIFDNGVDSATVISMSTEADGKYELNVPPGTYDVYAQKDGYAPTNRQQVTLSELDPNQDGVVFRDLYLSNDFSTTDIKRELTANRRAIAAEEVMFALDSYQLDRRFYRQLKDVVAFMEENPDATLQVAGHTCSRGTNEHNQQLSKRRAQAVADYLAKQGVNQRRVRSVGYGETKPLVSNATEANRKLNRRVEFELVN